MIPELDAIPNLQMRKVSTTTCRQCEFCDTDARPRRTEIFGFVVIACKECGKRLTEKARVADAKNRRLRELETEAQTKAEYEDAPQRILDASGGDYDCLSVIRRNLTVDGAAYQRRGRRTP